MVFESAAGAPKNQVFLDQVSCRTPPRGGGVSADLNHLSKITGFLNHLSPMPDPRLDPPWRQGREAHVVGGMV